MGFFDLDKLFGDEKNHEPILIDSEVLYMTLALCLEKDFEVEIECEHGGLEHQLGIKKNSQKKTALYLDDEVFDTMDEFKCALQESPLMVGGMLSVFDANRIWKLPF